MNMNGHDEIEKEAYMESDASFTELYPLKVQMLDHLHWTPLHIAKLVAGFLADKGAKVLDIGSGVGKFCLAAAYYAQDTLFYGVEQRAQLVDYALKAQQVLDIKNVSFIHANITEIDLRDFDHFYFYNSFQEIVAPEDKIDDTIGSSEDLYDHYVRWLYLALQQLPAGTRVATFHFFLEMPGDYLHIASHAGGDLNFWVKQ